jgi:hypothetical protein
LAAAALGEQTVADAAEADAGLHPPKRSAPEVLEASTFPCAEDLDGQYRLVALSLPDNGACSDDHFHANALQKGRVCSLF